MTTPALEKTYNFDVQNQHIATGNRIRDHQTVLLNIKNALKAQGGWTVTGSHDGAGSLGNNDDVDRWVEYTDLVFANTGNICSWIVLEQSSINSHTQILFWLGGSSDQYEDKDMQVVFSAGAGFGATYGGTDGTTTARPTATDEVNLHGPSSPWLADYSNSQSYTWHVMCSTDGEISFVVACHAGEQTMFLAVQKPKNTHPDWANPAIAVFRGDFVIGYSTLNDSSYTKGYVAAAAKAVSFRCTTEMAGSSMIGQLQMRADINGNYPLTPMGLRCVTTGARGHLGVLRDIYFASTGRASGQTYPGSGDAVPESTWAQFGDIVLPWNTETPVLLT